MTESAQQRPVVRPVPRPLLRTRASALGTGASMGLVRAGFRAGERLAPSLAARGAQRVWFRVPPAPPPAKRDRGIPAGRPLPVRVAGGQLSAFEWGQGPTVLLVHGWSGWWQQFSLYVEPLVAAGLRVVAWDAPSHGASSPGRFGRGYSGVPDLLDGVLAVAEQAAEGRVHGIVAHSVGAMAAGLALGRGVRADRLVLVAPSVTGEDQLAFLAGRLAWGTRTRASVVDYVRRRYDIRLEDFDLPALAESGIELPPTLVVHDEADEQTPVSGSRLLAERWPDVELRLTQGLGHFKVLWDPATVAAATDFLRP